MVSMTINAAVSATIERIYAAHAAQAAHSGDRPHLGASLLGHACLRSLFYVFRWQTDPPDGRLARLFQTGHREEARLIAEGLGYAVAIAPNTRLADCQAANVINGQAIQTQQLITANQQRILHGGEAHTLYDARGTTALVNKPRAFSQA